MAGQIHEGSHRRAEALEARVAASNSVAARSGVGAGHRSRQAARARGDIVMKRILTALVLLTGLLGASGAVWAGDFDKPWEWRRL